MAMVALGIGGCTANNDSKSAGSAGDTTPDTASVQG